MIKGYSPPNENGGAVGVRVAKLIARTMTKGKRKKKISHRYGVAIVTLIQPLRLNQR